MSKSDEPSGSKGRPATKLVHSGRNPEAQHGFVNTPVYRGSTVLFPTLADLKSRQQPYTYGRRATPTTRALEEAITSITGGAQTILTSSGLCAVSTALLAFIKAGDNILMTDSVYQPTRAFCDGMIEKLQSAAQLCQGEFAPGIYEDWAMIPREHLREEALEILNHLVTLHTNNGQLKEALEAALTAIAIDPSRESNYQICMRLYRSLGNFESGLNLYRTCKKALAMELGVEPSELTKSLAKEISELSKIHKDTLTPLEAGQSSASGTPTWVSCDSNQDQAKSFGSVERALLFAKEILNSVPKARIAISTTTSSLTLSFESSNPGQIICDEASSLLSNERWIDCGIHHSVSGPQRIFTYPGTSTVPAAERVQFAELNVGNSYIGREVELQAIVQSIESGRARLITLTGPGGIGKTRLSKEVGRKLLDTFADRVSFVRLETATTQDQLWVCISEVLIPNRDPKSEISKQVLASIGDKKRLLILDNFEQLIDSEGANVVNQILQFASHTTILVSSRRRLNLQGESVFPLLGLSTKHSDTHLESVENVPAVVLFVDRAKFTRPDFEITESNQMDIFELCKRLEGFPLSIELAASRVQVLTPRQLLDRFDNRFDLLATKGGSKRHQSLRNAIDWHLDLMTSTSNKLSTNSLYPMGDSMKTLPARY